MCTRCLHALLAFCVALGACGTFSPTAEGDASTADAESADRASDALTAPAASAGAVHFVRLIARGDHYAFDPSELSLRSGDVVRFIQTGHQPESVAFDPIGATPEARDFMLRHGLVSGPLLTDPGAYFDVAFEDAPPGEYPFLSASHREFGMVGRVTVEEE
jgi:plastocyanin